MKTVKYYRVEVTDKTRPGILGAEQKFEIVDLNVIAENDRYLAVDDYCFTSIRKDKSDYQTCLNKPVIGLYSNDNVWGNRITYTLYTEGSKRPSTIVKEIEAEIAKKYGFFLGSIDLSFIADTEAA